MSKSSINKREPKKSKEWLSFIQWSCIPATFKKLEPEELEELGIPEWFNELAAIKTRYELAEFLNVDRHTLADWSKLDAFHEQKAEYQQLFIRSQYGDELDHAFSVKTIKEADAHRVRLWKELFAGYIPKAEHKHSGKVGIEDEFTVILDKLEPEDLKKILALKRQLKGKLEKGSESSKKE